MEINTISRFFSISGLALNTLASLVLIWPYLRQEHLVGDDFIIRMDKKGKFLQKKHIKERKLNIFGLSLLTFGFISQLVSVLV